MKADGPGDGAFLPYEVDDHYPVDGDYANVPGPASHGRQEILQKDTTAKGFTIDYLKDTWQLDATDLSPQINKS
jgi:hypothetical protein